MTTENLLFCGFSTMLLGGIVLGVIIQFFRGRRHDPKTVKLDRPVPAPARPPAADTAIGFNRVPTVFISYRRRVSWSVARSVANSLRDYGAEVFLDVDDINEGRFAQIIEQAIQNCEYFVPIIAPGTLESKWVVREIAAALAQNKVVIPLVTDGFSFYGADLPPEIAELSSHNAIKIMPEFFEEAMERLATRFIGLEARS